MDFSLLFRYVLLGVLALAGLDRCLGGRMGLADGFAKGFETIGALILTMVGMNTAAPLLGRVLAGPLQPFFAWLGADPSMLAGTVLAGDMGGYALAKSLCLDPRCGGYAGAVVASMMGCTLSFTIPFGFTAVKEEVDRLRLARGLLIGMITMPAGCIAGGWAAGLPLRTLAVNLLPMLAVTLGIGAGLRFFPAALVRGMAVLGKLLTGMATAFLTLAVVVRQMGWSSFFPDLTPFDESLRVVGEIGIVLAGAFPLLSLMERALKEPLRRAARRLRVGEEAVAGLMTTMVSSIPTLTKFHDMDPRGQVMNAAFAVSASYVFGDHLGFTASVCPEYLPAMLLGKLAGGLCALVAAGVLTRQRKDKPNGRDQAA